VADRQAECVENSSGKYSLYYVMLRKELTRAIRGEKISRRCTEEAEITKSSLTPGRLAASRVFSCALDEEVKLKE